MPSICRREFLKRSGSAAAGVGAVAGLSDFAFDQQGPSNVDRPNILFFFPDQHRYDWTAANERLPIRMPNLKALVRRGVRFEGAYCASPLCGPSRACLASGKEYDRCRVPRHNIPYPEDQPTFYGLLRESGYHVMGCGKFDLDKGARNWGKNGRQGLHAWGFTEGVNSPGKWDAVYDGSPVDAYNLYLEEHGLREVHYQDMSDRRDKPRLDSESWGHYKNISPTELPERAYSDNWVARNGLQLIRQAPDNRPWFLQVNFPGPHEPMDITHRMNAQMKAREPRFPQPVRNTQLTAEHHQAIRTNYAAMIENIDRWLGIYIDELEKRGELENTVVVYSSDHGEMLGDRNRWAKSMPYEPSVSVPLVVTGPDVRTGHRSTALVSLIDVAATFLDVAGVSVPSAMDGKSLLSLLEGERDIHREFLYSGLYGWRTVTDGRYKLIRGFHPARGPRPNEGNPAFDTAPALLFDLREDPGETRNLAEKRPALVAQMTKLLRELTQTD